MVGFNAKGMAHRGDISFVLALYATGAIRQLCPCAEKAFHDDKD
jgi:hypothetical protein